MSAAALARISTAVNTYVSGQAEVPTVNEDALARRSVAGVTIPDPMARNEAIATRRRTAQQFQSDAEILNKKLAEAGVTSLGTLPKQFWNTLCRDAGLFHLRPDKVGRVRISTEYLKTIGIVAGNIAMSRPLKVLLGTITLVLPSSVFMGYGWWSLPIAAVVGIVSSVLARSWTIANDRPRGRVVNAIENRQLKRLRRLPETTLKQLCWPDGVEPSYSSENTTIRIELPPPPPDVVERLTSILRVKVPLSLYVHPDAVAFVDHPATALAGAVADMQQQRIHSDEVARQKREAERKARWEAFTADPIVVAEHGSAIAIIAQYGEFPIEIEVVERALAAHPLL